MVFDSHTRHSPNDPLREQRLAMWEALGLA